mmetsp:Transcript_21227/g.32895  ORF Transcript_21227/g.32895 Transcript_21227/m.32895 type:complete len:94 (+) Transcript_21227:267-548(+)
MGGFLNDLMAGFIGYTAGHLLACNYIYKHRLYLVERLNFEKQNNFDRDTFDLGTYVKYSQGPEATTDDMNKKNAPTKIENRLLEEYPFAEFVQ